MNLHYMPLFAGFIVPVLLILVGVWARERWCDR